MHEPHRPRRFEPPIHSAWQVIATACRDVQTSPHIRRSYETAWNAICRFLDAETWAATSDDVTAWIASRTAMVAPA